jgi:hypothetical protein
MRTLEFRTLGVVGEAGMPNIYNISPETVADLRIVMTRVEAAEFIEELEPILAGLTKESDKQFIYFTLRGVGRGVTE